MTYKGNILIVDDEQSYVEIFRDLLNQIGEFKYTFANDGAEAIRKARNQKYSLICTDYRMPKVSGVKLIGSLRETSLNSEVPIILCSGYLDEVKQECLNAGIKESVYFLEKPFDHEKFLAQAKDLLQAQANSTSLAVKKNAPKLNVDFINPFIEATILTMESMAQVKQINAEKPRAGTQEETLIADISGCLSIVAPSFKGNFQVSFPKSSFLNFVSAIFGETHTEITAEVDDAVLELTNIIYGQAKGTLAKFNYKMERAIPSIIRGGNHSISVKNKTPCLIIPFTSTVGPFFISISIE